MELYFTALLMGLLGAGHCAAMCGSLSLAVGFSIPSSKSFVSYAFYLSLGRISGYTVIGLVVSALSQSVVSLTQGGIYYLTIASSILMILVGLHIANISNVIVKTEKLGQLIEPILNPMKKKMLPVDSVFKCLGYGFLWGFLPCGLVYTAISMAMTASSVVNGGLVMFCFGLGTLPALIGLTAFNANLNGILGLHFIRLSLGIIVVSLAVFQFASAITKLSYL